MIAPEGNRQKVILIEDAVIVLEANFDALGDEGTLVSLTQITGADPRAAAITLLFAASNLVGRHFKNTILATMHELSNNIQNVPYQDAPPLDQNLTEPPF